MSSSQILGGSGFCNFGLHVFLTPSLTSTFAKYIFLFDHSFYENLKNPKWPPGGPKMADGVWKGAYPQVLERSRQLSLNKFLDSTIPSMKTSKIQNGGQGAPKWPIGS